MTDRPILFSAPMVRALLDGRKTQTRRIIKPAPVIDDMGNFCVPDRKGKLWNYGQRLDGSPCLDHYTERCVRFAKGDRLWVRENWYADHSADDVKPRDMDPSWKICPAVDWNYADWGIKGRLRPGIHMPRWASRLTLTVTDARVQRLQEISDADALAEGVYPNEQPPETFDRTYGNSMPVHLYGGLWDHINGPGSWSANPWVVAVTFSVTKGNIDEVGEQVRA